MPGLAITDQPLNRLQPLLLTIPEKQAIDARADEASIRRAIGVEAGGAATGRVDELHRGPGGIEGALQQGGEQQIAAALAGLGQIAGPAHRVEDAHAGQIAELAVDAEVTKEIHMGVALAALKQEEQLPQPGELQGVHTAAEIGQLQAGTLRQQAGMGAEGEPQGTEVGILALQKRTGHPDQVAQLRDPRSLAGDPLPQSLTVGDGQLG